MNSPMKFEEPGIARFAKRDDQEQGRQHRRPEGDPAHVVEVLAAAGARRDGGDDEERGGGDDAVVEHLQQRALAALRLAARRCRAG